MTLYRTIVADPPWPYPDGALPYQASVGRRFLPYPTMTIEEIKALPVPEISDHQAHLYLWTTTSFLEQAFSVVRAWAFNVSAVLVWCKPHRKDSLMGGDYAANVEFVVFAKANCGDRVAAWLRSEFQQHGIDHRDIAAHFGFAESMIRHWLGRTGGRQTQCPNLDQWRELKCLVGFGDDMDEAVSAINAAKSMGGTSSQPTRWFEWPRGEHSAKPEAFLDLVEQVSPGPYLEMFARRQRLGWDTWGDEALQHVNLEAS